MTQAVPVNPNPQNPANFQAFVNQENARDLVAKTRAAQLTAAERSRGAEKARADAAEERADAAERAMTVARSNLGVSLGGAGSKIAAKAITKAVCKTSAKAVPIVGLFLGIFFAIYRATKGEYAMAAAEFASGAASCIPGAGTVLSIAMDVAIAAKDVHTATQSPKTLSRDQDDAALDTPEIAVPTLDKAYEWLGVNLRPGQIPTQEEVDRCYRQQARLVHPDTAVRSGAAIQEGLATTTTILNRAKEMIYQHHKWA